MNTPDPKQRELAEALAQLETAAARVASLAGDVRRDLTGDTADRTPSPGAPPPPAGPPGQAPPGAQGPGSHVGMQGPPGAMPVPAPGSGQRMSGPEVRFSPGSPQRPGVPSGPAPSGPPPAPQAGPGHAPPGPVPGDRTTGPGPQGGPATPPAPVGPVEVKDPWWSDDKAVLRVMSVVGATIVILGVALLIALAIESGLLGPLGRVILAYGLAVALAGAGVWVHRKHPGNAGVAALGVTSVTTAHLTTLSLVHILEWWPNGLGLAVILAVTAIGYAGSRIRGSAAMIIAISYISVIAGWFAIPYLENGWGLAASSLLLVPAGAALTWWGWNDSPAVSLSSTIGFIATALLIILRVSGGWPLFLVYGALAIALGAFFFLDASFRKRQPAAAPTAPAPLQNLNPYGPVPGFFPAPASGPNVLPLRILAWSTIVVLLFLGPDNTASYVVATILGLIIGGLGLPVSPLARMDRENAPAGTKPGSPGEPGGEAPEGGGLAGFTDHLNTLGYAGFITAALPAVLLAVEFIDSPWQRLPVAAIAAVVVWVYVFRPTNIGRVLVGVWTAAALLGNGPAIMLTLFSPTYIRENGLSETVLLARNVHLSGLLLGVIAFGLLAIVTVHRAKAEVFEKAAGLAGLALTAVPVVTLLTTIGLRFSLAHMLVSVGWMAAAAWLMLAPKRLNVDSNLAGALIIAGAAVVKLVFYDMQAMSGITRVFAFLICGLILLGMAVIGSRRNEPDTAVAGHGATGQSQPRAAESPAPVGTAVTPGGPAWSAGPQQGGHGRPAGPPQQAGPWRPTGPSQPGGPAAPGGPANTSGRQQSGPTAPDSSDTPGGPAAPGGPDAPGQNPADSNPPGSQSGWGRPDQTPDDGDGPANRPDDESWGGTPPEN